MGKWSQLFTLPSGSGDAKFNKFVGGPNGFATLGDALAAAIPGDAILVRSDYISTSAETVTVDNILIEWAPNAKTIIPVGSTHIGITISSASGVSMLNANLEYQDLSGAIVAGMYLSSAENCRIYGATVSSAGTTSFTRIVGVENSVNNMIDMRVDVLGTITSLWSEIGTATNNIINIVHKQSFIESSVGKLQQDGDTTTWGSYPVIDSPVDALIVTGSHTFDCSEKGKFHKTGGAGTFTLSQMKEGQTVIIVVNSTGSVYSITWSPTIKWPSASVPTPTTTASRQDIYNFIMVGGIIYGTAALAMG